MYKWENCGIDKFYFCCWNKDGDNMKICQECGSEVKEDENTCPRCGSEDIKEEHFCRILGTKL